MKGVDRRKKKKEKRKLIGYLNFSGDALLKKLSNILGKKFVRSGIRTHAHRSGLRPERSALDHSAILTM